MAESAAPAFLRLAVDICYSCFMGYAEFTIDALKGDETKKVLVDLTNISFVEPIRDAPIKHEVFDKYQKGLTVLHFRSAAEGMKSSLTVFEHYDEVKEILIRANQPAGISPV